jgi:thiamine pyrophosphate-dependent acetolactate synthase large subunit-like protein
LQFEPALQAALASDAPTLIHVLLDSEVISPRATITQLRGK